LRQRRTLIRVLLFWLVVGRQVAAGQNAIATAPTSDTNPAQSTFRVNVWLRETPAVPIQGTAFVIDSTGDANNPTVYFLTAAHVILGGVAKDTTRREEVVDHVEIRFDNSIGGSWPINLDAIWFPTNWESTGRDFAIIKVVSAGRPVLPLKLIDQPVGGYKDKQFVAYGFPPDFTRSVPVDGKVIDDAAGNSDPTKPWLLVTSSFTHGMSGGPVVTSEGVFGTIQGRTDVAEELKYVIPISHALPFIREIIPGYPNAKTTWSSPPPKTFPSQFLRIAVFLNGEVFYTREILDTLESSLHDELSAAGYTPIFEHATGSPDSSKAAETLAVLKDLLQKFPDSKPDYLVTVGTEVSEIAYKYYFNKLPIVFIAVTDPIRSKLVKNFDPDRTRGNIAGVVYGVPLDKFLGFFQTAFPRRKFGFVFNPNYPQDVAFRDQVLATAPNLIPPMQVVSIKVTEPRLTNEQQQQADIFFGRFFLMANLQQFLSSSSKPLVAGDISNLHKGALATINTDSKELARLAVYRIIIPNLLKGQSLCDLPVVYPDKVITGVNLRSARQYGISISDKAIEEAAEIVR